MVLAWAHQVSRVQYSKLRPFSTKPERRYCDDYVVIMGVAITMITKIVRMMTMIVMT